MSVNILGVSMSSHDRAAALLRDGEIIAAVSEERLDRRKKSQGFYAGGGSVALPPMASITRVLRYSGLRLDDLDLVVCGRSVTLCRETLLSYLPADPKRVIEPPVGSHHLAHGYSAYGTSPFERADVLVIDEQGHHYPDGTFERCTWFTGEDGPLTVLRAFRGSPVSLSLGMFFDVFAALTGLSEGGLPSGGKLMALAGFGRVRPDWPPLISFGEDGDAGADLVALDAFLEHTANVPVNPGYELWPVCGIDELRLKYRPVHWSTDLAADLAAKAQAELERAVLHTASRLRALTDSSYLCYAGGVALNCTVNSRLREVGYEDVFIHPAATDDGCAAGLAIYGWLQIREERRKPDPRFSCELGGAYDQAECQEALVHFGLGDAADKVPVGDIADLIAAGKIVCWYQGGSEWGPRALGRRSILANPTLPDIVGTLNARVKFREPFRPFGLSVAEDALAGLLDVTRVAPSLGPYMLAVAPVVDERLRGMQHRDGTIRYQTVDRENGIYHVLLLETAKRIGLAAVLNTSFNTMGEPLVETPFDAVRQFLLCEADALYLDGYLLSVDTVPAELLHTARERAQAFSRIDRLNLALQQEAAGYPEAARASVAGRAPNLSSGPDRARIHAALTMRLAMAAGDREIALNSARQVISWSGMPESSVSAARLIAENAPQDFPLSAQAAAFLVRLSIQGRALSTLEEIFRVRPERVDP